MVIALVVLALAGKLIDFGGLPSDPQNPRRPSPEAFTPKFWDAETRAWLNLSPGKSDSVAPGFALLPSTGVIEDDIKNRSSTGSAFSISETGLWLTARHVASGCDKIYIQTGERKALLVNKVDFHKRADIALLSTRNGPAPLLLASAEGSGSDAFGVGFPKGQPGAVHAAFIGQITLHHRGRNGYREQVNAWSERSRIPNRNGSLGGLSGGVVLNAQGRVTGIVQAESRRRGRIMTARLETIREFLNQSNATLPAAQGTESEVILSAQFYPQAARRLITTLRVAKVLCFVQ